MSELTRALEDAVITRSEAEGDGRTIELRLMKWGDVAVHTAEGFSEAFKRGAFSKADPKRVTLESQKHGGPLVGVAESIKEDDVEARGIFKVAKTVAGDELLELARAGVLRDASVVFAPISHVERDDGVIERTAVDLRRVALLERGAYPSAELLAVREEAEGEKETVEENIKAEAVDLAPVMARFEDIEAKLGTIEAGVNPSARTPKYPTLDDYTSLVYRGEAESDLMARALAEQETANNGGLIPENWLKDVKRIVNLGRRGITAFGGPRSLGAKGMTLDYPYLNSSNTLTAIQTEVAEIQNARVDIAKGSEDILTFAGGSMMSYQLIQRSEPSYREAYNRIVLGSWANLTDSNFISQLEADATGAKTISGMYGPALALANPSADADDIIDTTPDHELSAGDAIVFSTLTGGSGVVAGRVYWVLPTSLAGKTFQFSATPGGTAVDFGSNITAGNVHKVVSTGEYFRSSLFEASVAVEDAVGQPAGVVLASTDMFLMLAGLTDMVSPGYGNIDASGMASASTLRMNHSGLEIIRDPNVSAGKIIVSSPLAAGWHEDGPKWVSAEDVAQLGTQVAVYSFGAGVVHTPAGVIEVTLI